MGIERLEERRNGPTSLGCYPFQQGGFALAMELFHKLGWERLCTSRDFGKKDLEGGGRL